MKPRNLLIFLSMMLCVGVVSAQGWRKVVGPFGPENFYIDDFDAITPTSDSGYLSIVHGLNGQLGFDDKAVVKIDRLGNIKWYKKLDFANYYLNTSKLYDLQDSTYLVIGYGDMRDSAKFIRIDRLGNTIKSTFFHFNSFNDYSISKIFVLNKTGIVFFNQDSYLFVKCTQFDLNFNILWEHEYSIQDYFSVIGDACSSTKGYSFYTTLQFPSGDCANVYLNKIDSVGNRIWSKKVFDYEDRWYKVSLTANPSGGVYLLANEALDTSSFITNVYKFNENGDNVWEKSISGDTKSFKPISNGLISLNSTRKYWLRDNKLILRKINDSGQVDFERYFNSAFAEQFGIVGVDVTPCIDNGYIIAAADELSNLLIKTDSLGRIHPNYVQGHAKYDQNHDCNNGIGEDPLKNWVITAEKSTGLSYYTLTDAEGAYEINADTGQYILKIHPPGPIWEPCNNGIYQANLCQLFDTAVIDIPVQDLAYCSLLNVSIATTRIRRCFNNTYWLNWQNFGTADAENVQIDVVLPPELDFVSANPLQPIVIGDTLRFSPGTVPYGASGSLSLVVHADCDSTILGQTLCVEAWIRPDTLCYDIPNWSGAEVVANARCTSDTTIQYTLKNVGNGPTGDLNYIITEDLVVLMTQPFNLNPNQEIQINQPFSGNLQRIIAEQAPNYPFDPVSAAAVETCGGSTNGLGQINQFPLTDGSPFVDISCSTVVSSFDPNDKTGFPLGYGTDHLLEANTDITYLIRFQNTGTDTAFRVVVRDTLSQWLDVASVQPGPASHPYRWNFEDGNVLAFHFDPIALPDSNVNQDASNGFIQFRIKQKPNLADGTEILNTADIYFDYNAPVRTNTTLHRIGKFEYTVSVFPEPAVSAMSVTVSPNPFSTQTTLRLGRLQDGDLSFELYDQQGRLMRSAAFKGGQYELSAEGLHAGMYTYALKDARGAVQGRGKIIVSSK